MVLSSHAIGAESLPGPEGPGVATIVPIAHDRKRLPLPGGYMPTLPKGDGDGMA